MSEYRLLYRLVDKSTIVSIASYQQKLVKTKANKELAVDENDHSKYNNHLNSSRKV